MAAELAGRHAEKQSAKWCCAVSTLAQSWLAKAENHEPLGRANMHPRKYASQGSNNRLYAVDPLYVQYGDGADGKEPQNCESRFTWRSPLFERAFKAVAHCFHSARAH
jgi:hypothetical protein